MSSVIGLSVTVTADGDRLTQRFFVACGLTALCRVLDRHLCPPDSGMFHVDPKKLCFESEDCQISCHLGWKS